MLYICEALYHIVTIIPVITLIAVLLSLSGSRRLRVRGIRGRNFDGEWVLLLLVNPITLRKQEDPKMANTRIARTAGGTGAIRSLSFTFPFRVLASAISIALCVFFTLSFLFTITTHSYSTHQTKLVSILLFPPYFLCIFPGQQTDFWSGH